MGSLLALAGFMGSGKSVVGSALAAKMGWSFTDLDKEIERTTGITIADSFRVDGEAAFRQRESGVLRGVLDRKVTEDVVIALGGGTLESEENRRLLRSAGTLVLLDVNAESAWRRVKSSDRPLAKNENEFLQLWDRRRSNYLDTCDWVIPTSDLVVDEVVGALQGIIGAGHLGTIHGWARVLSGTSRRSLIVGGQGVAEHLRTSAERVRESAAVLHVLTDTNVRQACTDNVLRALAVQEEDLCVVEAGEQSKSVAVLERCWEWMARRKAKRDDVVVAVGGGVVGDLAGFVAATYHRGVRLWQVPTSLLAQVDSSVGGKTAINLSTAKNQVGAFHQADLVVIDPRTLVSLPEVEYVGALGEVVKHALLSSGEAFSALEVGVPGILARDGDVLSALVKRNVWHKAGIVEEDERETGIRASLNLGHTTAHALESVLGYGTMNHGQAVALGLLVALAASEKLLGLDERVRIRTESLLMCLGLATKVDLPCSADILAAAGHDKKSKAGNSGFVGLRAMGEPVCGIDLASHVFEEALEVIRR